MPADRSAPRVPRAAFPPPGWALAPPGRRLAAWAVDLALIVVTVGVGWAVLAVRLWGSGTTPGKKLLRLVVFATDTRKPADRRRMAERALLHRNWARLYGITSFGTGFVYLLVPVLSSSRRAIHDDWARTSVLLRLPESPAASRS